MRRRASDVPIEIETEAQLIEEKPVETPVDVVESDRLADDSSFPANLNTGEATPEDGDEAVGDAREDDIEAVSSGDGSTAGPLVPFDPLSRYLTDIR